MTINAFRAAVEGAVQAGWTATRIHYGVETPLQDEERWIRINIYPTISQRTTIGKNEEREIGVVRIEIYVKESDGNGLLFSYADTLGALLRAQTLGGGHLQAPSVKITGQDSGWLRANLDTPYYRNTCF